MSPRKPSVYRQGVSIYVIGTDDTHEACRAACINPETHRWSSTSYGHAVRRKSGWQFRDPDYLPKDARPAVAFIGPINRKGDHPTTATATATDTTAREKEIQRPGGDLANLGTPPEHREAP